MNERTDSSSENGPAPEMTPRLSATEYDAKIETLAERMLHRLADDETGELMAFDEVEIRPLLSETEEFHAQYPFSAIEHGDSEPTPGAWSWIDDGTPKESLRRQALGTVASDVHERLTQLTESEDYTYRQDGATYVRETGGRQETDPFDGTVNGSDSGESESTSEREYETDSGRETIALETSTLRELAWEFMPEMSASHVQSFHPEVDGDDVEFQQLKPHVEKTNYVPDDEMIQFRGETEVTAPVTSQITDNASDTAMEPWPIHFGVALYPTGVGDYVGAAEVYLTIEEV